MSIDIVEAVVTANKCYQAAIPLHPQGIMLHSIGCPQPNAAVMAHRYNTYQPDGQSVCVHGFVQRDGTYYHTLPYNLRAWHCGGSANQTHIGIEMTEPASIVYTGGASWRDLDPAATEAHVRGTYRTAVALFAQLCEQYALDPLADGVIISHAEGAARGVASRHADPTHLWRAFGLTMDGFRRDVYAEMRKNDEEDDEDMIRYNTIDDVPGWARGTVKEMMDAGLIVGTGGGRLDLSDDMLRMLYIMWNMHDTRYGRIVDGKVMGVPVWAQDTVQKLVDDGALEGMGNGKLDLSMDMIRTLVVCQRMSENK